MTTTLVGQNKTEQKAEQKESGRDILQRLRKPIPFAPVVGVVEKMKQEDWKQFSNRHGDGGRDPAFCLAREFCALPLNQLGQLAGHVDSRTVSKAIQRFQTRPEKDHPLARLFAQAANELSIVAGLTPILSAHPTPKSGSFAALLRHLIPAHRKGFPAEGPLRRVKRHTRSCEKYSP